MSAKKGGVLYPLKISPLNSPSPHSNTTNISYKETKQRIILSLLYTHTKTHESNCFTYYQAKFHPHEYSIVQTYY